MVIGVVCPQCKQFITEKHEASWYSAYVDRCESSYKQRCVENALDHIPAPKYYPPPPPPFLCKKCKLILEPTDGIRDHITVTEWEESHR